MVESGPWVWSTQRAHHLDGVAGLHMARCDGTQNADKVDGDLVVGRNSVGLACRLKGSGIWAPLILRQVALEGPVSVQAAARIDESRERHLLSFAHPFDGRLGCLLIGIVRLVVTDPSVDIKPELAAHARIALRSQVPLPVILDDPSQVLECRQVEIDIVPLQVVYPERGDQFVDVPEQAVSNNDAIFSRHPAVKPVARQDLLKETEHRCVFGEGTWLA